MTDIYNSVEGARAVRQRYREFLRNWPVPNEQAHIPTCQGGTFVVVCGHEESPPLVLLHGSTANTAAWMGDVPSWAEHFRVYAVDMIGEPGLSAPARPELGSDAYARWLDDVLTGLAVERASIVGVSLGGWLALDYAIRRPERVERLALLCPGGIGRQKSAVFLAAALLMLFGRWGRRTAMRLILGTTPPRTQEAAAFGEFMALIGKHFRPRRLTLPVFDDAALRALRMPIMVIAGGRDSVFDSAQTCRRVRRAAPHAVVRLLPDAGHLLLNQTKPILDFLLTEPDPSAH